VEVDESRGMHICEEAVKRLKTVGVRTHTSSVRNTRLPSSPVHHLNNLLSPCLFSSNHITSLILQSATSDLFKVCLSSSAVLSPFRWSRSCYHASVKKRSRFKTSWAQMSASVIMSMNLFLNKSSIYNRHF